jgi:hypothetical protein
MATQVHGQAEALETMGSNSRQSCWAQWFEPAGTRRMTTGKPFAGLPWSSLVLIFFNLYRIFVLIVFPCPKARYVSENVLRPDRRCSLCASLLSSSFSFSTTVLFLVFYVFRVPLLVLLLFYIRLMVKFPFPVHPEVTPDSVQVPEIVLFFTVPCSVSTLPLGVSD